MKHSIYIIFLLICIIASIPTFAQHKMAFLVGISDYGNPREDPDKWLNICGANDVNLLSGLLGKQGFSVTTLTDKHATYNNITKGLERVYKSSNIGDIVYLHFSMHGQPVEDLNGDEPDGWDESLIPVDAQKNYKKGVYEGKCHLTDDVLEKYITKIRSKIGDKGLLLVIMDACHSGESSRGDEVHIRGTNQGFSKSNKYYKPNRSNHTNDYFKIQVKPGYADVIYMEACRSYQYNKELYDKETGKWYGPLSYYIAKVMKIYNIGCSVDWVNEVKTKMDNYRPNKQNMVIETTIK